jgi:uroporphyrinogen-III synthase
MNQSILLSPADAQTGLVQELVNLGGRVIHWPNLSIDQAEDSFALDEAIENLFGYDWLLLKSEPAVKYFLKRFKRSHTADELDKLKILSIGEETHQALGRSQIHLDVMVDRSVDLFAALKSYAGDVGGLNLLLPSANISRAAFERELEDAGARVDSILAYRTCSSPDELIKLKALITGGAIDFVAFTQPAGVAEFASLFDTDDLQRVLAGVGVACLDESTSSSANGFGLATLIPPNPSVGALARLIGNTPAPKTV